MDAARTGKIGDGKVWVTDVEQRHTHPHRRAGRRRRLSPPASLRRHHRWDATGSSPRRRRTRPSSPSGPPTWTAGCVASSRPRWPAVHGGPGRSSPSAATAGASCARPATSTSCCCTTAGATSPSSRERLWYPIWDEGLKLGHAVRTTSEALALAADDLDTATSLLDVRHLAGDPQLADELATGALAAWEKRGRRWLAGWPTRSRPGTTRPARWPSSSSPTSRRAGAGCATCTRCAGPSRARQVLLDDDLATLDAAYDGCSRPGSSCTAAPVAPGRPGAPGAGRRGRRARRRDADALMADGSPRPPARSRGAATRPGTASRSSLAGPGWAVHPHATAPPAPGWCCATARCTSRPTPIRPRDPTLVLRGRGRGRDAGTRGSTARRSTAWRPSGPSSCPTRGPPVPATRSSSCCRPAAAPSR